MQKDSSGALQKRCAKCELIKSLDYFNKRSKGKGGKDSRCKECNRIDAAHYRKVRHSNPDVREAELKKVRERYHNHYAGKIKIDYAKRAAACLRWNERNPEKVTARQAIRHMAKKGFRFHHWSYNEQHHTDVIELTTNQHYKAHRFIVYDQPSRMYRRRDTNELLTTKAQHEAFIRYCITNFQD